MVHILQLLYISKSKDLNALFSQLKPIQNLFEWCRRNYTSFAETVLPAWKSETKTNNSRRSGKGGVQVDASVKEEHLFCTETHLQYDQAKHVFTSSNCIPWWHHCNTHYTRYVKVLSTFSQLDLHLENCKPEQSGLKCGFSSSSSISCWISSGGKAGGGRSDSIVTL